MNTYIYAPKDDIKHRALWRQLYTKEEESTFFSLTFDEHLIIILHILCQQISKFKKYFIFSNINICCRLIGQL